MAVLVLLPACGGSSEGSGEPLTISNSAGEKHHLRVEIADTPEKRQHGLMGRTQLSDDEGMLFVFETHSGFWMKDTPLPLSAAFIDRCGAIVALVDMQPFSLDIHNPAQDYRFGLEVKGGWFAARRIAVGDKVTLPKELRDTTCA